VDRGPPRCRRRRCAHLGASPADALPTAERAAIRASGPRSPRCARSAPPVASPWASRRDGEGQAGSSGSRGACGRRCLVVASVVVVTGSVSSSSRRVTNLRSDQRAPGGPGLAGRVWWRRSHSHPLDPQGERPRYVVERHQLPGRRAPGGEVGRSDQGPSGFSRSSRRQAASGGHAPEPRSVPERPPGQMVKGPCMVKAEPLACLHGLALVEPALFRRRIKHSEPHEGGVTVRTSGPRSSEGQVG